MGQRIDGRRYLAWCSRREHVRGLSGGGRITGDVAAARASADCHHAAAIPTAITKKRMRITKSPDCTRIRELAQDSRHHATPLAIRSSSDLPATWIIWRVYRQVARR